MIKNYKLLQMDLTIHGVAKAYFVDADIEVFFNADIDSDVSIKSIDFKGGIIIDRYNDAFQFPISHVKNNSLYDDLIKQIVQAIEDKKGIELCDEYSDLIFKSELSAW